jgi:hypothetical protein
MIRSKSRFAEVPYGESTISLTCPCLGNLTDALHITPQTADTAMKIILTYLLIGSYASLFWLWRQRNKPAPTSA